MTFFRNIKMVKNFYHDHAHKHSFDKTVEILNPQNFDCLLTAINFTIEAENETYPHLLPVSCACLRCYLSFDTLILSQWRCLLCILKMHFGGPFTNFLMWRRSSHLSNRFNNQVHFLYELRTQCFDYGLLFLF